MGMHEFEWCVEGSVRCLAASPRAGELDLRSLFKALYAFEGRYDTGFTRYRVIDLLIEHQFAYAFPIEEHPDFPRHGRRLLPSPDRFEILRDPTRAWDPDENPVVAYLLEPDRGGSDRGAKPWPTPTGVRVVCEAGAELWARLVEAGRLSGGDAVAPAMLPIEEVAATVAREAEARGDRKLVRTWFPLLFQDLLGAGLERFEHQEVATRPAIREFRAIARRLDVRGYPEEEMRYGVLSWPTAEDLAAFPGEGARWWFGLEG